MGAKAELSSPPLSPTNLPTASAAVALSDAFTRPGHTHTTPRPPAEPGDTACRSKVITASSVDQWDWAQAAGVTGALSAAAAVDPAAGIVAGER